MNKRYLFLLFYLLLSFSIKSQQDHLSFADKNQLSISLINGINNTQSSLLTGEDYIKDSWETVNVFRLGYRYQHSKKFYLSAGIGYGFQSVSYLYEQSGAEPKWDDRHDVGYFSFLRFDLLAAYNIYTHKRSMFNIFGGAGWNRFNEKYVSLGVSYGGLGHYSSFTGRSENNFLGFLMLGAEYARITKKKNELSFRVFYQHGFNSFHQIQFTHNDYQVFTTGTLSSLLRGFNFSVDYTFTRDKNRQRMYELLNTDSLSIKEAKAKYDKERRYVAPDSRYIVLGSGAAFTGSQVNRSDKNSASGYNTRSTPIKIGYEHGWRNNFFFEGAYRRFELFNGIQFTDNGLSVGGFGVNAFPAHFVQIGMGYRVQTPNSFIHLINLHAGIGIGFTLRRNGIDSFGSGVYSNGNYTFNYSFENELTGNIMPVVYAGLSRDFRLTQRLGLQLGYRYQIGVNNIYNTTITMSSTVNPSPKTIVAKINGTASIFEVGLKYRIK
jgi:hypothetical protein